MEKQLVTFSLLSTQWQKYNKSYIDNFIPLFATMLFEKNISSFEQSNYDKLSQNFKELFEIQIPSYLISSLVTKLLRIKIITKERDKFIVNSQRIIDEKLYIKTEINSYSEKENILVNDFISFSKNMYNKDFSKEDSNRIILSFINVNDVNVFFKDPLSTKSSSNEEAFIVGKYVANLFTDKPELYKYFVNFSLGSIALNALYYVSPESEVESLKKCVFFFDSSFIFPLLGIDSMQRESIIKDIVKEIHSNGGFVKIYRHTYDEILEILNTSIRYIESPDYDPRRANKALSFLRQEGFSIQRVELIIQSIDRILKENYISVDNEIPDKKLCIDENALTSEIVKNLSLKSYETPAQYTNRTKKDVDSIIFTYERRKKILSKNFKDAKYSFITENGLLTSADKKIIGEYINNKKEFFLTAAIPEAMLCAYLYLGSANKIVRNTTFSVLATALASIRPTNELEALVKDTANRLKNEKRITDLEFNLVTTSYLIKDYLADKTLCCYEKVTEDTIFSLIEDAKDSLAIEERQKRIETEKTLFQEEQNNIRRKEKAERIARQKTLFQFIGKMFLLFIPYIFSCFSLFNLPIYITITTFVLWTIFCILINHGFTLNFKSIWTKIYYKQLYKSYEYFELDTDQLKNQC